MSNPTNQREAKEFGFINFMPLIILALIGLTFGAYQILELIIWLFKHVRIV